MTENLWYIAINIPRLQPHHILCHQLHQDGLHHQFRSHILDRLPYLSNPQQRSHHRLLLEVVSSKHLTELPIDNLEIQYDKKAFKILGTKMLMYLKKKTPSRVFYRFLATTSCVGLWILFCQLIGKSVWLTVSHSLYFLALTNRSDMTAQCY